MAGIGYLPARDRLAASATRFVYGAKEAPDEALRTFGSRLTRAVPMDELLLQLAESLRKTMALTRAEVYTGTGDVLERAVSVPDAGPRSIVVTPRERPVVTRAGVSGSAWVSVWLPALLEGREQVQLRMAPVSYGGELLGLIVVERPATPSTTHSWMRRCRRRWTSFAARPRRCASRGPGSWPAVTLSGAAWSAICTTAPSRTSSRWR